MSAVRDVFTVAQARQLLLSNVPGLNRYTRRALIRCVAKPYGHPKPIYKGRPDKRRPYLRHGSYPPARWIWRACAARAAFALGLDRRRQKRCAYRAERMALRAGLS